MIERTISQSMYNARIAELEDIEKEQIYKDNLDNLTCRKMRYQIQGKEWTKDDQAQYDEAYTKCLELIKNTLEEKRPQWKDDMSVWNADKLVVVSDEEYEKLIAETQTVASQQGEVYNVRENKDDKQVL